MEYDIACKNCQFKDHWSVTLAEYEKQLKEPCPKCKGELYQDFSTRKEVAFELKGYGWTRKVGIKKGSQAELDSVLRENDYLTDKAKKHDHIDNSVVKGYKGEHGNVGGNLDQFKSKKYY